MVRNFREELAKSSPSSVLIASGPCWQESYVYSGLSMLIRFSALAPRPDSSHTISVTR